jgi:hypothetical protein
MHISTIYERYTKKISDIYLHKRVVRSVADAELKAFHNLIKTSTSGSSPFAAIQKMMFKSTSGSVERFGFYQENADDRIRSITLSVNSQYRWLLVEAYEAFEDFVEEAYAFAGFNDRNAWPLKDFGSITLNELSRKDFDWFRERAKEKRDAASSIMSRFRDILPNFSSRESTNCLEINLKFVTQAIALFRHIIVHNHGRVWDKTKFYGKVFSLCGMEKAKERGELEDFLNQYFGRDEYENTIFLLEIEEKVDESICVYHDRFEDLSRLLLAEAHLLSALLHEQFS